MDFEFLQLTPPSGLDPVTYSYFHNLLEKRTIIFNDTIDETIVELLYMPLREFENDNNNEPVTLILNSCGGSVTDGFFMAHYLATYKKKLNIIVLGCAASMAAIILAGCAKNPNITTSCYPSTYALIHDGFIALEPSESKTAGDIMAFNDKLDQDIRQFMIDHTNITPEEYDAHVRKQWFLNSEELKKYGMIDEIIQ